MTITDSYTGRETTFSIEEIEHKTRRMRAYTLTAITCAQSGHPGGSLSAMEIVAALFLDELKHDPANSDWPDRDRFFLSKAHAVPALYAALVETGYHRLEDMVTLRRLGSPFQGHTDRIKLKGIEMSGGSLGQGFGVAVGCARAAKIDIKPYRVYVLMGDGEQQEGSIWEAAMSAADFRLDNLVAIVDKNNLQIDGRVESVMDIDPLADKYKAFNWNVIEIDGHSIPQLLDAFKTAREAKGRPTAIIARTIKGKGVGFMEGAAGWHGKAPSKEQYLKAIEELNLEEFTPAYIEKLFDAAAGFHHRSDKKTFDDMPAFSRSYWWNCQKDMVVRMEPTRFGFGKALANIGDDPRVCTIHADISDSIKITDFEKDHPERLKRVVSVGIAEQNMMLVAAGLAKEGKIPVTGTYGVFCTGRPWDQIRTTICYAGLNVKIAGAHGGISVGPDGATHQALEELALMSILPNMTIIVGCDSLETQKVVEYGTLKVAGPTYFRFGREATPVVTRTDTPFTFGVSNVYRYRHRAPEFLDAFEIIPSDRYQNEKEAVAIIACGAMVPEAMRAAWILKEETNIEARVVNLHTIKPLDEKTIMAAVSDIGTLLTVEEHQVGGFGNLVAGAAARLKTRQAPLKIDMVGVCDRFGESGDAWLLTRHFGLSAEWIAARALNLLKS
ncbi:MAG: transketolase [Thermodesulfobacteriota bacterium]